MSRGFFPVVGWALLLMSALVLMNGVVFGAQRRRSSDNGGMPTAGANELIVHGLVIQAGGATLGRLISVERNCGGRSREAVFADSKGRFSFNLGVIDRGGSANLGGGTFSSAADLETCVIRASLSGYRVQTLSLEGAVKSERGNLGEMILQPLGKGPSGARSTSDADVPSNARKEYEAGLDDAAKSKWPEALASLKKATADYGKFATAWLALGMLEASRNDRTAALHSYEQALAADEKFAPAYVELAAVQTAAGDWNKAIESSAKATAIDPDAFPRAYYVSAISNVRLNDADAAQKSAEAGLRADVDHEVPDLEYIEGILLLSKGDAQGGRRQLQNYLAHAPGGINAGNAREQLAEIPESK